MNQIYQQLNEDIDAAKQNREVAVKMAEKKKEAFIRSQTFTGDELIKMRDEIRAGDHGTSTREEPWLNYVLDRILQYRE